MDHRIKYLGKAIPTPTEIGELEITKIIECCSVLLTRFAGLITIPPGWQWKRRGALKKSVLGVQSAGAHQTVKILPCFMGRYGRLDFCNNSEKPQKILQGIEDNIPVPYPKKGDFFKYTK